MKIQEDWIKRTYYGNVKNYKSGGRYRFFKGMGFYVWCGYWAKAVDICEIIGVYLVDKKQYEWRGKDED